MESINFKNNKIIIAGYGKKDDAPAHHESIEGVLTGLTTTTGYRVLSKTQVEIMDLISEGMINGLVSGQYIYSGALGNIGWDTVTFTGYVLPSGVDFGWLPSVYWNETPVADTIGKFNFQQITINYTKGDPNGSNMSDDILDELTISRSISERLRGGVENAKIYRILNKNCIAAEVNIRISELFTTKPQKANENPIDKGRETQFYDGYSRRWRTIYTPIPNEKTQIPSSLKSEIKKFHIGDIVYSEIEYKILYRPIFNNTLPGDFMEGASERIYGKISQGYIRNSRINFNIDYSNSVDFLGWELQIVRFTEDATSVMTRNQSFVDSLTEIYGSQFIYPNSAIVSSLFDAEFFSAVPNRAYDMELLKIKIPSNYDPIYRTYDESVPWDGSFKEDDNFNIKKEWSNNPAWCYYDLITNKRYGLGNYIDEDFLDKFALYDIGKYCDTLVPDGYGGLEPRFECNVYLTSPEDAYKVLNAMAGIFYGANYYSAGLLYAAQDSQKPPVYQFTNANVVDGNFNYSSTEKRQRHSVATIRYNDKNNLYKPSIEYVENIDAIRKYGVREIDVPAYGCTSRGQAIRLGRWTLLSESLETEFISFRGGVEISLLRPFDIIQVYDNNRRDNRLGGRLDNIIVTPDSTDITLDSQISGFNSQDIYKIGILTPSFFYDSSIVTGIDSSDSQNIRRTQIQYITFNTTNVSVVNEKTNIFVNTGIDFINYNVSGNHVWLIEGSGEYTIGNIGSEEWKTYKISNIREIESHIFELEGLEYNIDKFKQIESGFSFTDSVFDPNLLFASPTNLTTTLTRLGENSAVITYSFNISDLTNVIGFKVFVKTSPFEVGDEKDETYVIANLSNETFNGNYFPFAAGDYYFRVRAIGSNNKLSNYSEAMQPVTDINVLKDITISSLSLSTDMGYNAPAILSTGGYYTDSPTFQWQTSLEDYLVNMPESLTYRITIRAPSLSNTPSSEIYFTETNYPAITSSYTFNFEDNYISVSNINPNNAGPFRQYDLVVEAMDSNGNSSAGGTFEYDSKNIGKDSDYNTNGYDIIEVNNPSPKTIVLYTGYTSDEFYLTGDASQQSITEEGDIRIMLTRAGIAVPFSEFFDEDIVGNVVYYSDTNIGDPTTWDSSIVTSTDNPILVPGVIGDSYFQWIAIAPYDSFDEAINEKIPNFLETSLNNISLPVLIKKNINPSYKAWIEFDVGYYLNANGDRIWGIIPGWEMKSFNIKEFRFVPPAIFTEYVGHTDVYFINNIFGNYLIYLYTWAVCDDEEELEDFYEWLNNQNK